MYIRQQILSDIISPSPYEEITVDTGKNLTLNFIYKLSMKTCKYIRNHLQINIKKY